MAEGLNRGGCEGGCRGRCFGIEENEDEDWLGLTEGIPDRKKLGDTLALKEGLLKGDTLGILEVEGLKEEDPLGPIDGLALGIPEGIALLGENEWLLEGIWEGAEDGDTLGPLDGGSDGDPDGLLDRDQDGKTLGDTLALKEGLLKGDTLGILEVEGLKEEDPLGPIDGLALGIPEGIALLGENEWLLEGIWEGAEDGDTLGPLDGGPDGDPDGLLDGDPDGKTLGDTLGIKEGLLEGNTLLGVAEGRKEGDPLGLLDGLALGLLEGIALV